MNASETITINAPLARVWQVAAHEFEHIDRWSSDVSASGARRGPDPIAGPDVAGRTCTTGKGETSESFVAYDESRHTFTYEITGDAMPSFVAAATNTWTAKATGDQTELTMAVTMATRGIAGRVMRIPMRFGMSRLLRTNLEELKHYIEHDEPHPRKARAIAKSRR
ncbi:MAG: SRPBCC family protein [Actinomycetota bacterium]